MRTTVLSSVNRLNGFYIAFVILLVVNAIYSPAFFTSFNLEVILSSSAALLLVSAGVTVVILTGRIDISVGSIMFLAGGLFVVLQESGAGPSTAMLLALLAAGAVGLINGVLIAYAGLSALLTTLGMMLMVRGLGLNIIGGKQHSLPEASLALRDATLGGISVYIVAAFVIAFLVHLILTSTRIGRRVIAVGCSDTSAHKLGLHVPRYVVGVYVAAALLAGLGGIVAVINLGGAQTYLGKGQEFVAIAAVVIGGTSLFGGQGSIIPGTLIGVLFLVVVENGLNLAGVSPFVFPFVTGAVILVAMYLYSLSRNPSH